jgi:hypothetical protein
MTEAIRAHHAHLAAELARLTAAVRAAAEGGNVDAARAALLAWYRGELLPHAAAEEGSVYEPGLDLDGTRLLVRAMVDEHRALSGLVDALGAADTPVDAVAAAAAAEALFAVHVAKENELLLPALEDAGVDVAALVEGLHQLVEAGAAQ